MSRTRQVGSLLVMAGFLALTTATSKPKKDTEAAPSATVSAPPPASAGSAPPAVLDAGGPADVDPRAIATTLGCDGRPGNVGCKLLKDFESAGPWTGSPVPETVWFGESNAIGGMADGKKEFFYLQASGGPLGFTADVHTLMPDNAREAKDAEKLLTALRLGGTVPGSKALEFMKVPASGRRTVVKTRGTSQVLATTPPQIFIRARGDRLFVVEHNGNFIAHEQGKGPGSALAWVAELIMLR